MFVKTVDPTGPAAAAGLKVCRNELHRDHTTDLSRIFYTGKCVTCAPFTSVKSLFPWN